MKLKREAFEKAGYFVKATARSLDQALFEYYFNNGDAEAVLVELASYQNEDGGFGKWLESDFALSASSPSASVEAFHYMEKVNASPSLPMVKRAIAYFLETFNYVEQRWYAVPKEVNDAPHAPWWHYDGKTGGCQIDLNIGNPSAEIVGYLHKYQEYVPAEFLGSVTDTFVKHLNSISDDADSMHEILCYTTICKILPDPIRAKCLEKLRCLVRKSTELRSEQWGQYCATPLFYTESRQSPFYDLFPQELESNLDYLITTQQEDGSWQPNWSWGQFGETWEGARNRWAGYLTVKNLKLLAEFQRI